MSNIYSKRSDLGKKISDVSEKSKENLKKGEAISEDARIAKEVFESLKDSLTDEEARELEQIKERQKLSIERAHEKTSDDQKTFDKEFEKLQSDSDEGRSLSEQNRRQVEQLGRLNNQYDRAAVEGAKRSLDSAVKEYTDYASTADTTNQEQQREIVQQTAMIKQLLG